MCLPILTNDDEMTDLSQVMRGFNIPSQLYPKATRAIKRTDIKNNQTTMFTIQQAGRYYVENDIIVTPSNNNSTIIVINASDVVLDLNGMVISQAHNNTATNLDAILVNTNVSNVLIMNGSINSISGIGIKGNSGVNNLVLTNVKVNACGNYGANFSLANNLLITNCSFTNCDASGATPSDGASGAYLSGCKDITIKNSNFSHNQSVSASLSGIGLNLINCVDARVENSVSSANKGASGIGFRATSSTTGVTFKNCIANYNEADADSGIAAGYLLNSAHANEFIKCKAAHNRRNSGTGSSAFGFQLESCNYNVFSKCEAKFNNASGGTGNCTGFLSNGGKGNLFKRSLATGNVAGNSSSSIGAGFVLSNAENSSTIEACKAMHNDGGTGEGYGILADGTQLTYSGSNARTVNCLISKNILLGNTGTAKAYGYRDSISAATGSANLLISNVSYGHGTVGTLSSSSNLTITNNMNFAFQFTTGDLAADYSADKTISELKIGGVGEMGRVSTSGSLGHIGFDNISLVD